MVTHTKGSKGFSFATSSLKPDGPMVVKLMYDCAFCRKKGAAVGCAAKGCRLVGHFPCLKQTGDFLFQCFDRFKAFCPHHAPKQRFLHASSLPSHTDLHTCCICLSQIKTAPSFSELYCPSCETFLHRDCLQVRQ